MTKLSEDLLLPMYIKPSTSPTSGAAKTGSSSMRSCCRDLVGYNRFKIILRNMLKLIVVILCYLIIIILNLYLSTRGNFFNSAGLEQVETLEAK